MGLLDDAIREHLELKRRRGADPEEVAREQHEALDPIDRAAAAVAAYDNEPAEPDGAAPAPHDREEHLDLAESGAMPGGALEDMPDALEDMPDDRADTSQPPASPAAAPPTMGETVELDMSAVFDEDAESGVAIGGEHGARPSGRTPSVAGGVRPAGSPPGPHAAGEESTEDSLEWEMPGDEGEAEAVGEPDEDVLEETPEFLRDTPEQDRLWFEQRPPRDFDFDK